MQAENNDDERYSQEVARRAVARAALHLGLDTMSEEALVVMGDVLLQYLQRVGRVLGSMVESSNRTSAHSNVLDALQAVDMCTVPAVHQMHLEKETSGEDVGWKHLANFLLGPNWLTEEDHKTVPMGTGKVGPSTKKKQTVGWDAPYLDPVPAYPQASKKCANPHQLDQSDLGVPAATSPDDHETLQAELKSMSDEAFVTKEWGSVSIAAASQVEEDAKKKKAEEEPEDAPPAKRVKLAEDDSKPAAKPKDRPPFVPPFLPPFPKTGPGRAIVATDETSSLPATSAATSTHGVRSSLVQMQGNQYWGSGWEGIKVPVGRKSTAAPPGGVAPCAVLPLEKASNARTSKILEGSMDTL